MAVQQGVITVGKDRSGRQVLSRPDELQAGSVNASSLAVQQHADQFGMRISRHQDAHLNGAPRVPATIPLSHKGHRR